MTMLPKTLRATDAARRRRSVPGESAGSRTMGTRPMPGTAARFQHDRRRKAGTRRAPSPRSPCCDGADGTWAQYRAEAQRKHPGRLAEHPAGLGVAHRSRAREVQHQRRGDEGGAGRQQRDHQKPPPAANQRPGSPIGAVPRRRMAPRRWTINPAPSETTLPRARAPNGTHGAGHPRSGSSQIVSRARPDHHSRHHRRAPGRRPPCAACVGRGPESAT